MKNTSPIWLSALRKPRLTGGKSAWNRSGAAQPRSEGPSMMPASISPDDAGLPDDGDRAAHQAGGDQDAGDLRQQQQDVGHQGRWRL